MLKNLNLILRLSASVINVIGRVIQFSNDSYAWRFTYYVIIVVFKIETRDVIAQKIQEFQIANICPTDVKKTQPGVYRYIVRDR